MITVQPREPGPCCSSSAPGDMTCVTPRSGNRHTADHHQHETSAPGSARQNRYTDPLHTASAERRHSKDSNLILFVVNDRRQLRSYRVDRIAGIKPTTEPFTPVYRVEF